MRKSPLVWNRGALLLGVLFLTTVGCGRVDRPTVDVVRTTDDTGALAIEPQFGSASPFAEGLAAVVVGNYWEGKAGFVNRAGVFVVNPRFARVKSFSEGRAAVRLGEF